MEQKCYRTNQKITSSGKVEKILGGKVPEGYYMCATHLMICDITTGGKVLELGYVDQVGEDHTLLIDEGTNQHILRSQANMLIEEGEQPFGRITTAGASDVCYFACHGELHKKS